MDRSEKNDSVVEIRRFMVVTVLAIKFKSSANPSEFTESMLLMGYPSSWGKLSRSSSMIELKITGDIRSPCLTPLRMLTLSMNTSLHWMVVEVPLSRM